MAEDELFQRPLSILEANRVVFRWGGVHSVDTREKRRRTGAKTFPNSFIIKSRDKACQDVFRTG